MKYQIFGSADSHDCDIMVFVEVIGNVAECKQVISQHVNILQNAFTKTVNVNLAVVKDGVVSEVFKGTVDEVNNSLFETYSLHDQVCSLAIDRKVPRNAGLKALRSMRAILSFISRTSHRESVKKALLGTATDKYELLRAIRLDLITDLGHKNTNWPDFYKTLAFQMGQSYLLHRNIESYTKSNIGAWLPELKPFLDRVEGADPKSLDQFKNRWLDSFDPKYVPEYEELRK